jgi:hypothetical protein
MTPTTLVQILLELFQLKSQCQASDQKTSLRARQTKYVLFCFNRQGQYQLILGVEVAKYTFRVP